MAKGKNPFEKSKGDKEKKGAKEGGKGDKAKDKKQLPPWLMKGKKK